VASVTVSRACAAGGDDGDSRKSPAYDEARPSFIATPTNVSVSLGQTAVLRCRVHNLGDKTVSTAIIHVHLYTPYCVVPVMYRY